MKFTGLCIVVLLALLGAAQAFVPPGALSRAHVRSSAVTELMANKRNTKDEKRMRNREAARRNRTKGTSTGKNRRRVMRLAKINEVRNAESEFMATAYTQVVKEVEKINPLAGV